LTADAYRKTERDNANTVNSIQDFGRGQIAARLAVNGCGTSMFADRSPARLTCGPRCDYDVGMIGWVRGVRTGLGDLKRSCCDLLFPPRCVCCGEDLTDPRQEWHLCGSCLAKFLPATWHGCNRCGGEIADAGAGSDGCESCRHANLRFDSVIPLGGYHLGLREAVVQMKRPSHDALSVAIGRLLVERQRERLAEFRADVIVPVPMYWGRRLGRGKNSPELLASCLAKSLGVPMRTILVRRRNTLPQNGLPPSKRFENVRGAFRVRRPNALKDARVLLVDDVLTTGATCSEAAHTLKQAGAAMVAVAVVARTEGHLSPKRKWEQYRA
jgi:ComF family protein